MMPNRREPDNRGQSSSRTGHRQGGSTGRDPGVRSSDALASAATLIHELGNLVDGSSRLLGLALRSLDRAKVEPAGEAIDHAHRHLETASFAMARMADLVHCAMKGASIPIGTGTGDGTRGVTIGEAVEHAVRVVQPEADESRIEIHADIPESVARHQSGAMYSVLLNGLRNSIESIRTACRGRGGPCAGRIEVGASLDPAPPGHRVRWIVVTITDDGIGPPTGADANRVFEHGFTTKPNGTGIGLALAASLVREMHGMIQLMPRSAPGGPAGGAVLRLAIPALVVDAASSLSDQAPGATP